MERQSAHTAALFELLAILRGDEFERYPNDRRCQCFATRHAQRGIYCAVGLADRILKHADGHLALGHQLQAVRGAVDAAHQIIPGILSGLLQPHDRTDRHFVVVSRDDREVHTLLDPVNHDCRGLAALPVADFLLHDLHVRVLCDHLFHVLGAHDRRLVTRITHQNHHVTLVTGTTGQLFHLQSAGLQFVRADKCRQRRPLGRFRIAVDEYQRNLGLIGQAHHFRCAFAVHHRDNDGVDFRIDQIAELTHLQLDVVLTVLHEDVGIQQRHLLFHPVAQNGLKIVVVLGHTHADQWRGRLCQARDQQACTQGNR
ncbi:hypothetical protein ALQ88_05893 [Pseudomonas savastanoi]|nr:hypothetical protein ALQ88_05893 [Pseudomonas savastanoi]